jgi:GrpB-like predicted nucleotidyltransferase (UPF0157 family)
LTRHYTAVRAAARLRYDRAVPPPIEIVDYDPIWPEIYEREGASIEAALGDLIERIEHTGSTAVPGLAAKPIVDILLGIAEPHPLDACVAPLQSIGYEYVPRYEDTMPWRRYFRKRRPSSPYPHNLHVVRVGSPFWVEHVGLRDWLRAHPEDALAYAEAKRELAPRFTDVNQYADAKTTFIHGVLAKAGVPPRPPDTPAR